MSDRVYPSAKPAAPPAAAKGGANPAPNKSHLYNPTSRLPYRPQPPPLRRRHGRGCCCSCCLWLTTAVLIVLLLAAVAGAALYAVYRPRRPSFSVDSLRLSRFNLTGATLNSSFNFSITARNPNRRIDFDYDAISVRILSGGVDIGDGSFAAFAHRRRNSTTLRTVISSSSGPIPGDVTALRSSLRSGTLPLKIQLDTKVRVRAGKMRTKKVGIRVTCEGIRVSIPSGKAATTSTVKCKVDPRVKIIKWTV